MDIYLETHEHSYNQFVLYVAHARRPNITKIDHLIFTYSPFFTGIPK